MTTNYPDSVLKDIANLQVHPLSVKVYGSQEDVSDLVASIRQHGILRPLVATADNLVISGKRRLAAAIQVGLNQVPVVVSPLTDEVEIELFLLEDNRTREKTNEQRAREYAERLRIERALAQQRMQQAGKAGAALAGRGRPRNEPGPALDAVDDSVTALPIDSINSMRLEPDRGKEIFPDPYSGQARDLAAAPLGWSGRTAEKASAVIQYADQTGDHSLIELLNKKSANTAYARLKEKQSGIIPPPFSPQVSNVWNFPGPTPGFGVEYPGRLPGDLLRNVMWNFSQADDLIVDPFAGGGVTMDVVAWWNSQPDLWPLRCQCYDLIPAREDIAANDVTRFPYLPDECQAAGLIFLDPPYWKQKRGEYSSDPTNLANLSLDQFHRVLSEVLYVSWKRLRNGGCLALLIGATQSEGQFIDHALEIVDLLDGSLPLVQRVIVPYTTQQFSGADVAQARKSHMLLKGYRDLLVWRKSA